MTLTKSRGEVHPARSDMELLLDVQVAESLSVSGDPHLLFQAISNLFDNAIKYAPSSSTIALSAKQDGNEHVDVAVTDCGPGIPEEYHGRVTERFYRVPGRESDRGIGFGLAMVAAVSRMHGAELQLQPEEPGLRVILRLKAPHVAPFGKNTLSRAGGVRRADDIRPHDRLSRLHECLLSIRADAEVYDRRGAPSRPAVPGGNGRGLTGGRRRAGYRKRASGLVQCPYTRSAGSIGPPLVDQ